jgi:hypothetical protein
VTESCRGTTETRKIERPLAFVTLRRIYLAQPSIRFHDAVKVKMREDHD